MKLHNRQKSHKVLVINDGQMLEKQLSIFAERQLFCAYVTAYLRWLNLSISNCFQITSIFLVWATKYLDSFLECPIGYPKKTKTSTTNKFILDQKFYHYLFQMQNRSAKINQFFELLDLASPFQSFSA